MSAPVPKAYLRRIGSEVDHKYIYLEEEEVYCLLFLNDQL